MGNSNYSVPQLLPDDYSPSSENTLDHPQKYLAEKPPKRWWGNPFLKGFAYTCGVGLAVLLFSILGILINYFWPKFDWISIIN